MMADEDETGPVPPSAVMVMTVLSVVEREDGEEEKGEEEEGMEAATPGGIPEGASPPSSL